jgi:hypothetical protein
MPIACGAPRKRSTARREGCEAQANGEGRKTREESCLYRYTGRTKVGGKMPMGIGETIKSQDSLLAAESQPPDTI